VPSHSDGTSYSIIVTIQHPSGPLVDIISHYKCLLFEILLLKSIANCRSKVLLLRGSGLVVLFLLHAILESSYIHGQIV